MIAAALLALISSVPAAPTVRAQADLSIYFRDADYPANAMVRGEEGNVAFAVAVASDGSVTGCRVTASSGSTALDEATCHILTTRAHYTPARNARGEAVPDEVPSRISWVLPREPTGARARANLATYISDGDYPASAVRHHEQGRVGFELDISPEGRVINCRIMQSSGSRMLDLRTCQIMLVRGRFLPARDAQGHAVPDTVSNSVNWVLPNG